MTILLTGGTGFFGKALLRHWLAIESAGDFVPLVTVLTRSSGKFLNLHPEFQGHDWLRFHTGDILSPLTLPLAERFTHIIHAAADSTFGPLLTPLERYDQIVDGTRNMLDYAVNIGAKRFLFTSSGGVYGPQPDGIDRIPEDYNGMPEPLVSNNAYGVAKRCAEHLCALYEGNNGLSTIIARCFAFVGQDLPHDVHFAIGNFIRDAMLGKDISVKSDGTAIRSYMDQRDLAYWLIKLLENGKSCTAYNVGSEMHVSIKDLAYIVRDSLAPSSRVTIEGANTSHKPSNRYVPDVSKAMSELGLTINYTLKESIEETASRLVI
jgi:UDP-glucuronate decarboxylase